MLNKALGRFVDKYIGWSLVLIILVRIALVTPFTPSRLAFHGKEKKYKAIEAVAGNAPVVFQGSFQNPSLYTFFTGKPSTVTSSLLSRRTQFDIWRFDQQFTGKTVFVYGDYPGFSNEYLVGDVKVPGFFTDQLQTTHDVRFEIFEMKHLSDNQIVMNIHLINQGKSDFSFNHKVFPVKIQVVVLTKTGRSEVNTELKGLPQILPSNKDCDIILRFKLPDFQQSENKIFISLNSSLGPTVNSDIMTLSALK
jgi:hypothetical protein